jgi:hypothetical protein
MLRSLEPPGKEVLESPELLREHLVGAASSLLVLAGIEGDPQTSREHILIANLLERAWRQGREMSLEALLREIHSPPMEKVGLLDVDTFFPAKERLELTGRLNNLFAAPGFNVWLEGQPLEIERLMFTPQGRPRLAVVSIAHLSDSERMFVVTRLLNELVAWMRRQSGTSSLRAILYMDEVFGYFPPTSQPPSKQPMLTLMKQARAFGLGVVLATQNPVDLDYKGLANAGTWFLGRLQTERDKARVLDGLEGAAATAEAEFDRQAMEKILSQLGQRVFLMNNVHEDAPVIFQSRWALSYLRGPLSRDEIARLMQPMKTAPAAPAVPHAASAARLTPAAAADVESARPVLPHEVTELFVPCRERLPAGAKLVYRPAVLGNARIHYTQAKTAVDHSEEIHLLAAVEGEVTREVWESADVLEEEPDLDTEPETGAGFAALPSELAVAKTYAALSKSLADHVYRSRRLSLLTIASPKLVSQPEEPEGAFRARLALAVREHRDAQIEKLRRKYAPKIAALQEQLRRADQRIERERSQATQQTFQTAVSIGASVLGALFGRKLGSRTNLGRATTGFRSAGRVVSQRQDVAQAQDTSEAIEQRLADLEREFQQETAAIQSAADAQTMPLETLEIRPKKTDISITRVALVWVPAT